MDIASSLPGILRWFEVIAKTLQELTPVEFACETMGNVNKELIDLIGQYRADPKRTINPFSMRLQGVIDANVMGGISKYQEAFFTETFLKSPQGQDQTANIQKLKCLILEQVQILETALELHGQLAPQGVQPLHKRLLERFSQLKQSLSGLGKLKRQHSESIVNTPLPPLPIEKRAMSLGNSFGVYEQDDIYTRPVDVTNNSNGSLNRDLLVLPELTSSTNCIGAPPIPSRPKSAGYTNLTDSPDVPPKSSRDKNTPNAPPLPPRGYTPDKRASNPMPFGEYDQAPNLPRRGTQKYSVVDISLEDSDLEQTPTNSQQVFPPNGELKFLNEFRDSGISTSSNDLNNLNNLNSSYESHNIRGHHKTNSNPEVLNIQTHEMTISAPPPIPPKLGSTLFLDGVDIGNLSSSIAPGNFSDSSGEGYCVPKMNSGFEEHSK